MKKGVIVTVAILSFFVLAIKSNADMKITPFQVTSPDDSAALRLSGSFSTRGYAPSPYGAVISGVNSYNGKYFTCGGYFSTSDATDMGVYGEASNTGNFTNYGGYFTAYGTTGRGVYGEASNTGTGTNYGGYFKANGNIGIGVYGIAPGSYGLGVYGFASGTNGKGVSGRANGNLGIGVYGSGGAFDFYAGGSGNYGSFTGAHEVKFAEDMPGEIATGMIVSLTGKTEARKNKKGEISLSSTLPTVTICTNARDKAVFGVIVSAGPLPKDHWYEAKKGEDFGVVNALGEGRVWVTDINGKIEAGDYITTSYVPGYGQLQDDDLMHSYTLGKAIEAIDWEQVTETVQHDGRTYKRYLIAVVYTSG